MNREEQIIHDFYAAFNRRDAKAMVGLYHKDIRFSDPVFPDLRGNQVAAMWEMLTTKSHDLTVAAQNIEAANQKGCCQWQAEYTFSKTGRKVTNHVLAEFEFKDGLISRHSDHFDFRQWARQAFGLPGLIFGKFPAFQNKVRSIAAKSLQQYVGSGSHSSSV